MKLREEDKDKLHRFLMLVLIGITYICIFETLENRQVRVHILHTRFDDLVPFCKYFIIPYLLWFVYVGATILWLGMLNYKEQEFNCLMRNLLMGMMIFVVVSIIYPNGHYLRPYRYERDIFSRMVRMLYRVDTSTNVLPSLHVYNSVVCMIGIWRNVSAKREKQVKIASGVLTFSIILATMFLKQHTVIDVVAALICNFICYNLAYNAGEEKAWGRNDEDHAHTY